MQELHLQRIIKACYRYRHDDKKASMFHYTADQCGDLVAMFDRVWAAQYELCQRYVDALKVWAEYPRTYTQKANWVLFRIFDKEMTESPFVQYTKDSKPEKVLSIRAALENLSAETIIKHSDCAYLMDQFIRYSIRPLIAQSRIGLNEDYFDSSLEFGPMNIGGLIFDGAGGNWFENIIYTKSQRMGALYRRLQTEHNGCSLGCHDQDVIVQLPALLEFYKPDGLAKPIHKLMIK